MERLFTIGVYGFDEEQFFAELRRVDIDLFRDLRHRRGVRGSLYAFANANRLGQGLEAHGIAYRHLIELAPDRATRDLQQQEDRVNRIAKHKRASLGERFIAEYAHRTLEPFDWRELAGDLEAFRRPVLFCVEGAPGACHRRLVATRLAAAASLAVMDLMP